MTISSTLRAPFVYVEFDPSRAFQGPSILPHKALIIGQRIAAGTKLEANIDRVTSADQAGGFYGVGSQLHRMFIAWFNNNKVTEVYGASLDDDATGVPATGTFTITGTATGAGTAVFYVGGIRYPITVAIGDTPTVIGDALDTAILADLDSPFSSANVTGVVTITAKNDGEAGNDIDLRINYYDGEVLPTTVAVAVVAMASGANNPDIQDIIDIMGDEWYTEIVAPYNDATSLTAIETELADRFGPIRMIDAVYFTGKTGNLATLTTYGNSWNSPHVTSINSNSICGYMPEIATAYAGKVTLEGQEDPARPFQTLELVGILPPAITERFTLTENNALLTDGVATFQVDAASKVRIQRAITIYQTNAAGAADIAYLDVNTMLTIMYLRYDFRTKILTKYPRAKLADDGTNFGAGQKFITPAVGKAEAISIFRQWEALGLVENLDQYINDLVCERSTTDPNRLNWILPPDLVNQFRIGAATIQFLLQSPAV